MAIKKEMLTTGALILMLTFAIMSIALPSANSQEPQVRETYAYIGATPNPVGVGQEVLLHVGITTPTEQYTGWVGLTVTVEKPDKTTETLDNNGAGITTDSTGGTGVVYVPSMVGIYYFQTHFPQQDYDWGPDPKLGNPNNFGVITYKASDSWKLALNVTEEQREPHPGYPLPSEYWVRPIDAQFREWSTIAGNWLATSRTEPLNRLAPYNDGPETGHILWTKPIAAGGIIGGEFKNELGLSYETGDAYEGKGLPPVIINGVLYYNRFPSNIGTSYAAYVETGIISQAIVAVDLHTGEELWVRENAALSFGQTFYWDSYNMHGAFAYLWEVSGSTWTAYDAYTGDWVYKMQDVPSGINIYGPKGEIYRYTVNLGKGWMTLWNSSSTVQPENGSGSIVRNDGSWGLFIGDEAAYRNRTYPAQRGIEWNKTIPIGLPGVVKEVYFEDRMLGMSTIDYQYWVGDDPIALWAVNLKPGHEGELLFNTTWKPPGRDLYIIYKGSSLEDRVFIVGVKETRSYYGFSLDTGELLWSQTEALPYQDSWDMWMNNGLYASFAYGTYFSVGTGGRCHAFNATTGELMWTYDVVDEHNEVLYGNNWPMQIAFITDGKIYLFRTEHKPMDPRWRGGQFICLNAMTGEKIFGLSFHGSFYGNHPIIGDSIIAGLNGYDNSFYAIGKGPSAISVTASPKISVLDNSVLIEGMVTDVSPGTEKSNIRARFSNGVPAVSDESMSAWMEYVYMQFPRPADITGVNVTLSVLDSNGNYRDIGTTTANGDGFFSYQWTPDIPGKYEVYASFAGSESYWPSHAITAFAVDEAPEATPPPTPPPAPMTDMYLFGATAGIIIAIAIVGALLMLMLKKR